MRSITLEAKVHPNDVQEFAKRREAKFVVVSKEGVKHIVLGWYADFREKEHVDLIPKDSTLIGGGIIEPDGESIQATWGSGTCMEQYGYDRPSDPSESEQILREVAETVQDWIKTTLENSATTTD